MAVTNRSRPRRSASTPATRVGTWFAAAAEELLVSAPDVALGTMLHATGVKLNGRFFAFARDGTIVVKVPTPRVRELIDSGTGRPFLSGRRVMTEWVTLQPASPSQTRRFVSESHRYAGPERNP